MSSLLRLLGEAHELSRLLAKIDLGVAAPPLADFLGLFFGAAFLSRRNRGV